MASTATATATAQPKTADQLFVEAFVARDESFRLPAIQKIYQAYYGRSYLNPKPTDILPQLHSRRATYRIYTQPGKTVYFYFMHLHALINDLYMIGQLQNGASIALKLLGFHPFFFISSKNDSVKPTVLDEKRLLNHLNSEQYRPKYWKNDDELPVVSATSEQRTHNVIFRRNKVWVYCLHFRNMSMLSYYRRLLADSRPCTSCEQCVTGHKETCLQPITGHGLDWDIDLYHEADTFTSTQMLFNMTQMTYCKYIEFKSSDCEWIAEDAKDGFGGYSDMQYTSTALARERQEAELAAAERAAAREMQEGESYQDFQNRRQADFATNNTSGRRRTRMVIEGAIEFTKLKYLGRLDLPPSPLVKFVFDYETVSGRAIRDSLMKPLKPPLPSDEPPAADPRWLCDPMDDTSAYVQLLDRLRERDFHDETRRLEQKQKQHADDIKKKQAANVGKVFQSNKQRWKTLVSHPAQTKLSAQFGSS
ncbi:MAG TPA: hypothetical protein VM260_19865, partial [Pirellula sp.]|nr:hypothetical protein [Pirellula sp.]